MDNEKLLTTKHVLSEGNDETLPLDREANSSTASPRDSATMDNERLIMTRQRLKEGKDGTLQLDPELWQGLSEELLENIIAKLPFASVVNFRRVCKGWLSVVIPRAARHLEASSRSTLLYFSFHEEESFGSAWWLQVSDSKSEWSSSVQEFESKSFPAPRTHEDVRLLLCDRGLMFFGFICKSTLMVRDIVVCNPLLSKSKTLGLPRRLRVISILTDFFVGATFDSETGKYCLVLRGVGERGEWVTLLYDSLASAWTINSSYFDAPVITEGRRIGWLGSSRRSVCSDGNLYWYTYATYGTMFDREKKGCVMKFDTQHRTWSVTSDLAVSCDDSVCHCQIASYKGKILMWHLHRDHCDDGHRPCKSDREMCPEISLMPAYEMKNIYSFIHNLYRPWGKMDSNYKFRRLQPQAHEGVGYFGYDAFSERNFICHVVAGRLGIAVLVHDTTENSYTTLSVVSRKQFPNGHRCFPENVWAFSPSLISLP